jgi:tetratricopeptide (TPR) repeat protein
MGEAIERGVGLIVRARPGEIRLDEATARLVRSCYELSDEDGPKLVRAMSTAEPTRNLLGRPTTCVGRDVELSMLEALLDECAQDSTARVAIVLGPAGAGKSRLRYELVRRASRRIPDLRVLFGRAQSVGAGSPFAPLRQALRLAAEIADGEDPETSRDKIERYIERSVSRAERRGALTVYLGELAGVPFPDGAHETLGAARQNPTLLGDAMRSAWLDFLTGLCETGPVILILEDMHWGDLPTASFVDAALSSLGDCPLFVLALARPEVFDVLPGLWETREPQLLRLGPLRRAAAVALAREVLGAGAAEGRIERVVELAEGNAFFLEELIRAVAEGRDELPESVLTMVQARLESLGSETRRVLRAGSVFGSSFRLAGVMALLGSELDEHYVAHELSELVQREWVSPRPAARGGGDLEYAFRHMVVQETVYATLTKDDRLLGHRLAAQWLEQTGSADASLLAEHYRRAELPERAARHYLRAAEQALEGADLAQTLAHVARALESNPDAQTRGALHYLAADAHFWRGEYQESERDARAAVELLPQGSPRWFVAIGALCSATGTLGKDRELMAWAARAAEVVPESDEARAAKVVCLVRASHGHLKHGLNAAADALIAKADEAAAGLGKLAALGSAWVHHGRSARAYYAGDMAAFVREVEASIAGFDEVGDWRTAGNARANLGYAALSMGDIERAERLLREALSTCERLGMAGIAHYVMHNLGLALALRGAFAEGIRLERQAIREAETRDEKLLIGATHLYMALILLLAGDAKGAEEEAKIAQAAAPNVPILLAQGLAAESAALLAQGRKSDGLAPARAAMALLEEHGGSDETEGRVRSAFVEALLAAELHDEAREAATFAVERLRERAARLGDPRLEQCFLEGVPEHARLIARAEQLAKPR